MTHQLNTLSVAASPTPAAAEAATRSSPPIQTASESSPISTISETPNAESAMANSTPIGTAAESSPSPTATEMPYASDASVGIATPPQATYQVIGIRQGDYLNVREGAGPDYQVVTKLEPGTGGILLGTKRVANGATTWQEITVDGQTGWVNAAYLALEPQAPASSTESSPTP
ncbi:MAG: SH3 domain-containing protein [Verrucomicrobia bacterium]|nr:SH3 domain-containing protein [Verrucomicrobiota bacterium]